MPLSICPYQRFPGSSDSPGCPAASCPDQVPLITLLELRPLTAPRHLLRFLNLHYSHS